MSDKAKEVCRLRVNDAVLVTWAGGHVLRRVKFITQDGRAAVRIWGDWYVEDADRMQFLRVGRYTGIWPFMWLRIG